MATTKGAPFGEEVEEGYVAEVCVRKGDNMCEYVRSDNVQETIVCDLCKSGEYKRQRATSVTMICKNSREMVD